MRHNDKRHGQAALILSLLVFLLAAWGGQAETATAQSPTVSYPKAANLLWPKLAARAEPLTSSPVVKTFLQFRSDYRPTTLLVVGEARDAAGTLWLKISLPMRPNGRFGWVKASAIQTRVPRTHILIDLSARTLRVYEGARVRYRTRVAIGRRGMETPTGDFYVTATFRPKERFFGAYAFETSAYSKLSEWPGGGIVGLHGTSMPQLLGKAVSHGCVRMSNTAARALKRLTPAGTPVKIVA